MSVKLRDDQMATLVHHIQQPKTLSLSDPGTGKTIPAVINQYRRIEDEGIATVWVQPKALMPKNVREILKFTPLTEQDVGILDGTKVQMDRVMALEPAVILMGPDRFKRVWKDLPERYKAIDVDEMHMCFGGPTSNRVAEFNAAQSRFEQSVMMSGTLINGRWDSAWPAINAINPMYYPWGWDGFLAEHAFLDERSRPISWQNSERLSQIFGAHGIRYTFEQIFGKQAVVFETEWVAMNDKQRAIYSEFEENAMLELENFIIDGTLPGVNLIRARQIMEHPNYFRDLRDPYNLPHVDIMPGERPAKLEALEIHFEHHLQTNTPVIVFAALVPQMREIHALAERMGLRPGPILNGDATAAEKNDADVGFVSGKYQCLVGSAPVCSVGYNWQDWGSNLIETDHVIFASLTYMDSDFIQGYRRTIRRARQRPLRVTTQAYIDSVDIKIMGINVRKSRLANQIDPTREIIRFNSHEEVD